METSMFVWSKLDLVNIGEAFDTIIQDLAGWTLPCGVGGSTYEGACMWCCQICNLECDFHRIHPFNILHMWHQFTLYYRLFLLNKGIQPKRLKITWKVCKIRVHMLLWKEWRKKWQPLVHTNKVMQVIFWRSIPN